jgi:acyl-CoA dehydrogenase
VGHAESVGATQARELLVETTTRMFRDLADPQAVVNARDEAWKTALWRALEEAGLTRAWVPEALDGAGASIADGFEILRVAGSFAVSVPLAETLLAGWLLSQAGMRVPAGTLTVAPVGEGDKLLLDPKGNITGRAYAVPFARDAAHFAFIAHKVRGRVVALVPRENCRIEQRANIAGEPRDDGSLCRREPVAVSDAPENASEEALRTMGAAVRAAQMSGALQAILERSVAYANERVAFERPISKFQVIQHNLARLAGESAAALAASGSAARYRSIGARSVRRGVFLEVASAKIRVGEAAARGAAIAHQVHGAIGFSGEHALHRFTQRLWAWRDDFGSESAWAVRLGKLVAAKGADALWPMLAAR